MPDANPGRAHRRRAVPDFPPLGTAPPLATPTGRAPNVSLARANAVLVLLAIAAFAFVTSEVLPFGLITLISTDLHRSNSEVGLLVTAYAAVVVATSIPLAHLTRSIPRRQLLSATLLVYVAGMLLASLGGGFASLLAGRMLTAFAQAQFWAVVTATAAGLFPAHVRGKIVSRLLLGPAVAGLLGLPIATWLGQHFGWRAPFYVLACMGVVLAILIALLVPRYKPADGAAARGVTPSVRRFVFILAITVTAILGTNTIGPYVTPYLRDVVGFSSSSFPVLFTLSGIAGLVAMIVVGRYLDRLPMGMIAIGLGMLLIGWGGVAVAGTSKPAAVILYCLAVAGVSFIVGGLANRALQTSPGSTDIGIATQGSFYNTGTALGSLVGSGVLAAHDPQSLPVLAAGFLSLALVLVVLERRFGGPRTR
ncbi:MAG TPA: MFS transporter [Demequinaceae bacterium]